KKTALDMQREDKLKRIKATYSADRVKKIIEIEDRWERLVVIGKADELLKFNHVHRLIYGAAARWYKKYSFIRLTYEDFLSEFYEVIWKVIEGYTWATDFYLYETMVQA